MGKTAISSSGGGSHGQAIAWARDFSVYSDIPDNAATIYELGDAWGLKPSASRARAAILVKDGKLITGTKVKHGSITRYYWPA